jgi:hypothetical protein
MARTPDANECKDQLSLGLQAKADDRLGVMQKAHEEGRVNFQFLAPIEAKLGARARRNEPV